MIPGFLLLCTLNGAVTEGGIYFRNVNDCMSFKNTLTNQSYMKKDEPQVYECMCKLIPEVDPKKVQVY